MNYSSLSIPPDSHVLLQAMQRAEVLLGPAASYFRELVLHMLHPFIVQLFTEDSELTLQVGWNCVHEDFIIQYTSSLFIQYVSSPVKLVSPPY